MFEQLREEILAAVKVAEKIDKPPVEDLVTDVYDQVPVHLQAQLDDLKLHILKNTRMHTRLLQGELNNGSNEFTTGN